MTSLEFVLAALILLIAFLAFALTIAAILLGSKQAKIEVVKLFKFTINKILSLLRLHA